jgi:hypothetical protein
VRTYLERDLQDLASISALPDFRRLMQAACLRVGQVLNQTELGRDVGLRQPTAHRWLNLLETSHLLVRLPAYAVNRTKRLVKSPRVFWGDTGVALHLGATVPAGAHLRTFRQEYGRKARAGLLLHTGRTAEWLTPDVLAVPWWSVL